MAQDLQPLPQPGLNLYSDFIATKSQTFIAVGKDAWSDKASYLISFATPSGEAGESFIELKEETRNNISFKTLKGEEVMRIVKQKHVWSGKGSEYHGMRGDGKEVWCLKLKSGWHGTEYQLQINEKSPLSDNVTVQNKVQGQDKGILVNGQPAATFKRHEMWSHMHRQDLIHVAPGMDILLALGVNWIRQDKQKQDNKTAVIAAVS